MVKVAPKKDGAESPLLRKNGISANYALINLLNGMIGPGCFSVAMAFKQGGLWASDKALSYGDMTQAAIQYSNPKYQKSAIAGKAFVNACLITFQIGVTSVSSVFVVDHIQQIFQHFNVNVHLSKTELLLLYGVAKTILNFLRKLKTISYVCMVGNIFVIAAIVIIVGELMTSKWMWWDLPTVTDFNGVTLAAGSLLYSFEGQAMVLPLENELKHPQDMVGLTGVLSTGMSLVTIVYTYCGFYGYITYGNGVCGSVTLNLPDNTLNLIVKFLMVVITFLGELLQLYVIIQMIWPFIETKLKSGQCSQIKFVIADTALRVAVVWVGIILAIAVPNLNEIIPLTGVTAGMLLSLIIPAILDVIVFYPQVKEGPNGKWQLMWLIVHDGIIALIGCFFLVCGLQSNIQQLSSPNDSC